MVSSAFREKFSSYHQGRILAVQIFSSPVFPLRDPDISDQDRQIFQDQLVASAKGPACTLIFCAAENARIKQDKATLLARACLTLNRSLCLLDCPTLVEEYIGETEKNLNKLIAEAESQDWILFFDEADALFGMHREHENHLSNDGDFSTSRLLDILMNHKGLLILSINHQKTLETLQFRIKNSIHFI
jgi:hypothetical protein